MTGALNAWVGDPVVTVRTNLSVNPQDRTGGGNGWLTTRGFGPSGAGTYTHSQSVVSPGGTSILTACRKTWSTSATGTTQATGILVCKSTTEYHPVTAGATITVSAYMRHTSATTKRFAMQLTFHDQTTIAGAAQVGATVVGTAQTVSSGDGWQRISVTVAVPAGAAGLQAIPDVLSGTGTDGPWLSGQFLDVSGLLIEVAPAVAGYFDGSYSSTTTMIYAWAAAAWNSGSTETTYSTSSSAGRWVPVDLKGPPGDMGPAGAAGAFTWPASNYRNFTNNRSSGDGISEPGPLSTANSGSNPCCKVNATNTSRVEVLTTGIMICAYLTGCSNVMINGGCYANIRRQPGDTVLASFVPVQGETDLVITAIFPVTVGDILSFPFNKVSGGTHSISTVIRTGLLV